MGGLWRCGRRALVAAMAMAGSVVVTGAAPAVAEEPTVVVTPDEVYDGQLVGMDISGFPYGWSGVVQCAGSILEPGTPATSVCTIRQVIASAGLPPDHVDWTVVSSFTTYDGSRVVDCRTEPTGCVAGVATISDPSDITSVIAQAHVPITFVPAFGGAPTRGLADGETVAVEAAYVPAGTWSIAQCGRAVVDDPSPAQVAASCGPAVPVTVAADGTFTADHTVHDPLTSRRGGPVPCGSSGCVVVLTSADDPVVRSFDIAFGPRTFEVVPTEDIVEWGSVELTMTGIPDGTNVHHCALPVGDDLQGSRCDSGILVWLDDTGSAVFHIWPMPTFSTPAAEPVDCRVERCALALFDPAGRRLVDAVAISFAPPPSVTLQPSQGLLDGQEMALVGEHLDPGAIYRLQRCADRSTCAHLGDLRVGPDGRIETTVPAGQQLVSGSRAYCRDNCEYRIDHRPGGSNFWLPYAMAEGELTVAPATGLDDGQELQVSGSELMPTYSGVPAEPFPTGGWALTQCDRAVLDQADLLGVFTHCSVPPPTRGVTIEGSTLDATFAVEATITRILGGTTDCTATPDACVVGLVRLEQDFSLSTHLVPVTFG
jgi:hypothetical protein